jgi:hypothetical protein
MSEMLNMDDISTSSVLACFTGKHVLVIDGKNNNIDVL